MSHKTKAMRLQNSSRNDDWEAHHATPAPAHQPWAEVCPDCGHDMWFDNHSHKWACAYMFCPSVKIMPGVKWSRR